MMAAVRNTRPFSDIGMEDVPHVGGKNASFGERYRNLSAQGVLVPNGFAVTAEAYRYTLDRANAWSALHEALDGLRPDNVADLARRVRRAREVMELCNIKFLGIDSISLNPDSVVKTTLQVLDLERTLGRGAQAPIGAAAAAPT